MKSDSFLFILTLALAFGTGNLTYFLKSKKIANIKDIDEISRIALEIRHEHRPFIRLDFNSDYPSKEHLQLLDDSTAFSLGTRPFSTTAVDCRPWVRNIKGLGKHEKYRLWMDHECDHSVVVTQSFFKQAPFLFKGADSYSYLKYQQLYSNIDKAVWLKSFSRFMHIKELRKIPYTLPRNVDFLRRIPQHVLKKVLVGYTRILGPNFFFIKTANMQYIVFKRSYVQREYAKAGYIINESNIGRCFFRAGNICFNKKPHSLLGLLSQTSIILFIVTLFLLALMARKLVLRSKRHKLEEERKKHALRVLTHELRTPVASLLLVIDELKLKMDKAPSDITDDIIRLESDIYRLKNLTTRSEGYLQTDSSELMNFNKIQIDSMLEFCRDIISEQLDIDISLENENDFSIYTDPYWLKMCITNLIENAKRYGISPVVLKLKDDQKKVYISVLDQGRLPHKNLKSLMRSKHENSKGLGLGLTIVYKTLKAMGGDLCLKNDPTEFIISILKIQKKDSHE